MGKFKIIAAFAASCALALALAGCGGGAAESNDASGDAAGAASSEAATGQASILINTEGMGVIEWAYENEEIAFDDDMPVQSAVVNDAFGQTLHIEARDYAEYEGWHFTKWTKDGADFSTDARIDVPVDGDAEYIAVFDFAE